MSVQSSLHCPAADTHRSSYIHSVGFHRIFLPSRIPCAWNPGESLEQKRPLVEEDQIREHLNQLDTQKSIGPDRMQPWEQWEQLMSLQLFLTGHSNWGRLLRTGRKQMSCLLQEGQGGRCSELQGRQPHLNPWERDGANPPGNHFQMYRLQESN